MKEIFNVLILRLYQNAHFLIFTALFAPSISTVLNTSPKGCKSLKISAHPKVGAIIISGRCWF